MISTFAAELRKQGCHSRVLRYACTRRLPHKDVPGSMAKSSWPAVLLMSKRMYCLTLTSLSKDVACLNMDRKDVLSESCTASKDWMQAWIGVT